MRDNMDGTILRPSSASDIYQDENCSSSNFFCDVTQAFSQRVAELQQLVCFRVEDRAKHILVRETQGIEANVRALEQLFERLRQRTQQELSALPKARALLEAAHVQQQRLQHISSNLPQHLPSNHAESRHLAGIARSFAGQAGTGTVLGVKPPAAQPSKDEGVSGRAGERRRRDNTAAASTGGAASQSAAPRWYVTAGELASVAGYMKGRLTLEKVNAALDELAGFAEACHKSMAAMSRNQLSRMPAEDRHRMQDMYHSIATKEGVKGRFWFLETDLKAGQAVKMDKTGKSILMLLRHLGRLQEVRANMESMGSVIAYVLQQHQQ
eukprot:GHRR01009980.1.p1 GENE.GHRR01009980.1~~GHRR01009980.1.p1  ORF type:complete len:325 (+),score=115.48 GHRR01009980.1:67-1041(+)